MANSTNVEKMLASALARVGTLEVENERLRAWIEAEAEQRGDADALYPPERQAATVLGRAKP